MKKKIITIFLLFNTLICISQTKKILIIHADHPNWVLDIQSKLIGTGKFQSVDIFDAQISTPTLPQLSNYDALLVSSNFPFDSPIGLGNVLADYIDNGGGVVNSLFAMNSSWSIGTTSRFYTDNYNLFAESLYAVLGSLNMVKTNPTHPIFTNVNTFNGGINTYTIANPSVSIGSYVIANWDNTQPLIVVNDNIGLSHAKRVDLNFYPIGSSDVFGDGWATSTDGALLIANSLLYVANDLDYLSISAPQTSLTSNCTIVAPSTPTTFDVTGSSISSTVTVSAPTGFEISASQNSGYASSLSLTPDGSGTVSSTLYVRLSAGHGGGISGTITASSAGVTTQTTTVSSTIFAPPSFSPSASGPFSICNEATYLVALATPNAYNGWTTSDPNVFSVNSSGYITATASGTATATITYTDACGQSVSQTVSVLPAAPSLPITDNRVAFKFNGNPQGPSAGSAIINYVGYDGYTYLSQTQPTQVGYYKANTQLGNEAGCPNRFYIFNCTTCNN